MLVVGLTGGIASGKSIVAREFLQWGIVVIDSDVIARELVVPGEPALSAIKHYFGATVLHNNGSLNRAKLREIIFAEPPKKVWLEKLLHPLIRQETSQRVQLVRSPYCVVVVPLLVETWPNPLISRVLLIDVESKTQRLRLLQRDSITSRQARQIIAAQAKRVERFARADDIIHNDSTLEQLKPQVLYWHQRYLTLAKQTAASFIKTNATP